MDVEKMYIVLVFLIYNNDIFLSTSKLFIPINKINDINKAFKILLF